MNMPGPAVSTVAKPPSPRQPPASRDDLLVRHVNQKVGLLQQAYLDGLPSATAALARLRRAVSSDPGSDPGIWFETLDEVPPSLIGAGDAPSTYERAIHACVTLYAIHQQSQRTRMHQPGHRLGRAIRTLTTRISGQSAKNDSPVLRRFHALGTASSLPETLQHLRGLITQLRGEEIPLDYGHLARDLRRLQEHRTAGNVRLQWGRDYHQIRSDNQGTATDILTPDPDPAPASAPSGANARTTIGDPA
jgi:CRISPR system Cascade subunit CasB